MVMIAPVAAHSFGHLVLRKLRQSDHQKKELEPEVEPAVLPAPLGPSRRILLGDLALNADSHSGAGNNQAMLSLDVRLELIQGEEGIGPHRRSINLMQRPKIRTRQQTGWTRHGGWVCPKDHLLFHCSSCDTPLTSDYHFLPLFLVKSPSSYGTPLFAITFSFFSHACF